MFLRGTSYSLVRTLLPSDASFSQDAQHHRQTDRQTDIIMPIAHDRLKTVGRTVRTQPIGVHRDFSPRHTPAVSSPWDSAERRLSRLQPTVSVCVWVVVVEGNEGEDRLFKELFETRHYNKHSRPVADLSETTSVRFGIALLKIDKLVCVS